MLARPLLIVAAVALSVGFGVHFLRAAEEPPKDNLVEKLLERIDRLEARVAELEKLREPRILPVIESKLRSLKGQEIPPSWVPSEINGQTFYYIPTGSSKSQPAVRE